MNLVETEPALHTLRGEQFWVSGPAWECPDTGERYHTPEQGNVLLARLYHAWRERHGIAPESLRQRVAALGLSDAQASALLGFGINQYRTYKNTDKLPSKSNARLLQMLADNRALPALIEAAGPALTPAARRRLLAYCTQQQLATVVTTARRPTVTKVFDWQGGSFGRRAGISSGEFSEAKAA